MTGDPAARASQASAKRARNATADADPSKRVAALAWERVAEELDAHGCAHIERLLTPDECGALVRLYAADEPFRSRVVMAR
ncbi:MAG TPA: proline hydroxylase, partial [Myxococcota bacterium]|nr:proline hydroxylase [Myxococcota bacterium]